MKIVNIFGLVVAVHVAVLLLIFAIPGCRSTSTPAGTQIVAADEPIVTPAPAQGQRVPELSAADLNPALASSEGGSGFPRATSGGRQSPTRPSAAPIVTRSPAPAAAPLQSYTVVRGDSLWRVSRQHGLTVRELAAANNLSAEAGLQLGQKLLIPRRAGSSDRSARAAAAGSDEASTYVVRAGDTLGAIARRHQTSVAALKAMNNLRSDLVRVGDKLLIPETGEVAFVPSAPPPPAATAPQPGRSSGGTMKHLVAPGETLGAIARRYDVKLGDLALANNISDPRLLRAGQELTIPGWKAPSGAAAGGQTAPNTSPAEQRERPPPSRNGDSATDDVPVIQVDEPVRTLRVEPEPAEEDSDAPVFR